MPGSGRARRQLLHVSVLLGVTTVLSALPHPHCAAQDLAPASRPNAAAAPAAVPARVILGERGWLPEFIQRFGPAVRLDRRSLVELLEQAAGSLPVANVHSVHVQVDQFGETVTGSARITLRANRSPCLLVIPRPLAGCLHRVEMDDTPLRPFASRTDADLFLVRATGPATVSVAWDMAPPRADDWSWLQWHWPGVSVHWQLPATLTSVIAEDGLVSRERDGSWQAWFAPGKAASLLVQDGAAGPPSQPSSPPVFAKLVGKHTAVAPDLVRVRLSVVLSRPPVGKRKRLRPVQIALPPAFVARSMAAERLKVAAAADGAGIVALLPQETDQGTLELTGSLRISNSRLALPLARLDGALVLAREHACYGPPDAVFALEEARGVRPVASIAPAADEAPELRLSWTTPDGRAVLRLYRTAAPLRASATVRLHAGEQTQALCELRYQAADREVRLLRACLPGGWRAVSVTPCDETVVEAWRVNDRECVGKAGGTDAARSGGQLDVWLARPLGPGDRACVQVVLEPIDIAGDRPHPLPLVLPLAPLREQCSLELESDPGHRVELVTAFGLEPAATSQQTALPGITRLAYGEQSRGTFRTVIRTPRPDVTLRTVIRVDADALRATYVVERPEGAVAKWDRPLRLRWSAPVPGLALTHVATELAAELQEDQTLLVRQRLSATAEARPEASHPELVRLAASWAGIDSVTIPLPTPVDANLVEATVTVQLLSTDVALDATGLTPETTARMPNGGRTLTYRYAAGQLALRVVRKRGERSSARLTACGVTVTMHGDQGRVWWDLGLSVARAARLTVRLPAGFQPLAAEAGGLPLEQTGTPSVLSGRIQGGLHRVRVIASMPAGPFRTATVRLPVLLVDGEPVPRPEAIIARVLTPARWRAVLLTSSRRTGPRLPGWQFVAVPYVWLAHRLNRHHQQEPTLRVAPEQLRTVGDLLRQLTPTVVVDRFALAAADLQPDRPLIVPPGSKQPPTAIDLVRALGLHLVQADRFQLATIRQERLSPFLPADNRTDIAPLTDPVLQRQCEQALLFGTDASGRFARADQWVPIPLPGAKLTVSPLWQSQFFLLEEPADSFTLLFLPFERLVGVSLLGGVLALVATILLARRLTSRWPLVVVGAVLLLLAGLCNTLPLPLAALAGWPVAAALIGLLIGRLRAPHRQVQPATLETATTVPAGPTVQASITVALFCSSLLAGTARLGHAQTEPEPRPAAAEQPLAIFVPLDEPGAFYVPGRWLPRIEQIRQADVAYLPRGRLSIDMSSEQVAAEGWIDLVVSGHSAVEVPVPLEGWSYRRLAVDGQAPLVMERDGRAVLRVTPGSHRLEFAAVAPLESAAGRNRGVCRIRWLPVAHTVVTVVGPAADGLLMTSPRLRNARLRFVRVSERRARLQLTGHLGPTELLEVHWFSNLDPPDRPARYEYDQVIVLRPGIIEKYVVLTVPPSSQPLVRVVLHLPDGWRAVNANCTLIDRGQRAELLVPIDRLRRRRAILHLVRARPETGPVELLDAINSPNARLRANYVLVLAEPNAAPRLESDRLRNVAADQPAVEQLLALLSPLQAERVIAAYAFESQTAALRLLANEPTAQRSGVELTAGVTLHHWGVRLIEVLQFETFPPTGVRIRIPAGWQLRSVRASGARWSLSEDNTALLLHAEASGTEAATEGERVRVELMADRFAPPQMAAWRIDRLLALPDTAVRTVQVELYRTADVALAEVHAPQWRRLRVNQPPTDQANQRLPEGRFVVSGPPPELRVKATVQEAITDWRAETTIAREANRIRARTRVQLRGNLPAGSQLQLWVPPMAQLEELRPLRPTAQLAVRRLAADPARQGSRWAVRSALPVRGGLTFEIGWRLSVPDHRQWRFEQPLINGIPPAEHVVRVSRNALPPGTTLSVRSGDVAVREEPDAVVLTLNQESPAELVLALERAAWARPTLVVAERKTRTDSRTVRDHLSLWLWAPFGGDCLLLSPVLEHVDAVLIDGQAAGFEVQNGQLRFALLPDWSVRRVEILQQAALSRTTDLPVSVQLRVGPHTIKAGYAWQVPTAPKRLPGSIRIASWQRIEQWQVSRLLAWASRFADAAPSLEQQVHRQPLAQVLLTVHLRCLAALPRLRWLREEGFWSLAPVGDVDAIRASVSALQDRRVAAERLARQLGLDLGALAAGRGTAQTIEPLTLSDPFAASENNRQWLLVGPAGPESNRLPSSWLAASEHPQTPWLTQPVRWLLVGVPVLLWLLAIRPLFYMRVAALLGAIALYMTVEGYGRSEVLLMTALTAVAVLLGLVEAFAWWRAVRRSTGGPEPIVLE